MLPNFLCIGAQKCGTTTLWHMLDAHPDICMARPRETRFFSEDVRHAEGVPAYELRHFAHWRGERAVGEKCPEYLYLPHVPERVLRALGGELKFLICLRSPAQRAYAHYRHNIAQLREARPFADVLEDEVATIRAGGFVAPPFGYIGRGDYAAQLERYFDLFGRERCYVINFEEIVARQTAVAAGVFRFLEVEPRALPQHFHAGHASFGDMRLWVDNLQGAPRVHLLQGTSAVTSGGLRGLWRALSGHGAVPGAPVQVRAPSPELQAFAGNFAALRELPRRLSQDDELRINQCYFSEAIERSAALLGTGFARWLEAGEAWVDRP
ncbi:sulfotransferase [Novosphingobium sp. TH158]|uniref:sulfotransferase family protein n=1 Tax=Novosphingobium sp. TH158 TaxID=2067455 RepID=UPI000C7E4A92|nr:sulfotransferase [Novosphingobium sp. TH158]PLK26698.1 hypothetical protein C0V78_07215 [Novosphingobium sp. TH158]